MGLITKKEKCTLFMKEIKKLKLEILSARNYSIGQDKYQAKEILSFFFYQNNDWYVFMLALSYIWFRCSVLLVTRKYHSTREPSPRPQTSQKGSKHLSFIAYIFSMFHCRASRKTGHTRARDSHVLPLLNNAGSSVVPRSTIIPTKT